MLHHVFPSLAKNLSPVAAAYGLKPLELPDSVRILVLETLDLVEKVLSSVLSPLNLTRRHIFVSVLTLNGMLHIVLGFLFYKLSSIQMQNISILFRYVSS